MASKDSNLPVDPDVKIPEAVKRAKAKAESYYPAESMRPADPPNPALVQAEPIVPAQEQPATEPAKIAPEVPAQVQPEPQPQPQQAPVEAPNFEHMYNSMKGRFDASQRTIGSMQEQMQQLGDELMRTQAIMNRQPVNQRTNLPEAKFITPEDEQNYGKDLLDVTRRAALEAVTPQLSALEQQNLELRQELSQTKRETVYDQLDAALPTWREINQNPRWRQWLSLREFNSAPVRQQQLDRSMQAADAPRVVKFFKDFLSEEVATGQMPAPQPEPPQPAPRVAAVSLASLAAPGRPNPASGGTQVPESKPIWTHKEISNFYDAVRTNYFAGRETEKQRIEADLFAAQKEGRVR